jgi:membrane protein
MAAVKKGFDIIKQTFLQFSRDECPQMAASLAYYTIFSLPPLLVIIILLLGLFLDPMQVQGWIESEAGSMVGPDAAAQIQTMIQSAREKVQGGFSLGLILSIAGLLFGATGALAQLQTALNRAWSVKPDPTRGGIMVIVMKRLLSFGLILTIAFLLLVSLVLSALISVLANHLGGMLPGGISTAAVWIVNTAVSLAVITLLFATIFKFLPDAKVAWKDVGVGAFFTAVLFEAGKFLISLYIGQSNPGQAFGAAAALAILLVWVYYSAMIVLLGAEFTEVWAQRLGSGIRPEKGAVRIIREERPADGDGQEGISARTEPSYGRKP